MLSADCVNLKKKNEEKSKNICSFKFKLGVDFQRISLTAIFNYSVFIF